MFSFLFLYCKESPNNSDVTAPMPYCCISKLKSSTITQCFQKAVMKMPEGTTIVETEESSGSDIESSD